MWFKKHITALFFIAVLSLIHLATGAFAQDDREFNEDFLGRLPDHLLEDEYAWQYMSMLEYNVPVAVSVPQLSVEYHSNGIVKFLEI